MAEKWKEVFGGLYAVSTFGRVKRLKPGKGTRVGKILKPILKTTEYDREGNPRQYAKVALSVGDGWVKHISVHRLVAETFIGPCPENWCVNHIDGDKLNNSLENLEYVSVRRNAIHASSLGLLVCGEQHQHAKVTEKDVVKIRKAIAGGEKYAVLCERYGLNRSTLHSIVYHKTWKHVGGPPPPNKRLYANRAKLIEDQVRLIREFYSKGARIVDLCKMFGVTAGTMHPLVKGKTWKHVT